MRSRNGQVRATSIRNNGRVIRNAIEETVFLNSTLCTDKHLSYAVMPEYKHKRVNHSAKQHYVSGMADANGIERVRAVIKRRFYGICHVSGRKHLQRYLNMLLFRLNSGNVKIYMPKRIDTLLGCALVNDWHIIIWFHSKER